MPAVRANDPAFAKASVGIAHLAGDRVAQPLEWLDQPAGEAFAALRAMDDWHKQQLFASCVARTLKGQLAFEPGARPEVEATVARLDIDFARLYRPDAALLFGRLRKDRLLAIAPRDPGRGVGGGAPQRPQGRARRGDGDGVRGRGRRSRPESAPRAGRRRSPGSRPGSGRSTPEGRLRPRRRWPRPRRRSRPRTAGTPPAHTSSPAFRMREALGKPCMRTAPAPHRRRPAPATATTRRAPRLPAPHGLTPHPRIDCTPPWTRRTHPHDRTASPRPAGRAPALAPGPGRPRPASTRLPSPRPWTGTPW